MLIRLILASEDPEVRLAGQKTQNIWLQQNRSYQMWKDNILYLSIYTTAPFFVHTTRPLQFTALQESVSTIVVDFKNSKHPSGFAKEACQQLTTDYEAQQDTRALIKKIAQIVAKRIAIGPLQSRSHMPFQRYFWFHFPQGPIVQDPIRHMPPFDAQLKEL